MKRSSIIIASIICVILSSCGQMLTPQQEREKAIAAALADFDRATENSEIIIISDIFCRHTAQGTKQAEKWVNDEIRKGNAKTAAEYAKNLKDFKTKRANERAKLEKDLRAITTEVETPKKAVKLVDMSAMLQAQR